jgi:predicted ester cyclase
MAREELTDERAEELKRLVERGFNERDPKIIEELLADRLIDHNTVLGGVDLRQRITRVLDAFEDARLTIDEYIFQGNTAAWRWTFRGTRPGRSWGVHPTGKQVAPLRAQRRSTGERKDRPALGVLGRRRPAGPARGGVAVSPRPASGGRLA